MINSWYSHGQNGGGFDVRRLDPKNPRLKVPETVYRSLTNFTRDPAPIELHRLKLAREIERRMRF